jgi:allophanate hydrolase subunit 2
MYKLLNPSIAYKISQAKYSQQDLGISPKGPSDTLSFEIAHILLGEPEKFICDEIIHASKIEILEDSIFCITGAHYQELYLNNIGINHSTVYKANKGDTVSFKNKNRGFRSYFMCSDFDSSRICLKMERFEKYFTQYKDKIRVIKGPEYEYLKDKDKVLKNSYKISQNSSLMGLKLETEKIDAKSYDIVSSPVCDGTIQLTKDGPIVLMRHRQTTGGYPRVLQVISVDINLIAQYKMGNLLQFEMVSLDDAKEILKEHIDKLEKFRSLLE